MERTTLDFAHHGDLGRDRNADGFRAHRWAVLHASFSARPGGGRVLSRRDYLSHALVSGTATKQGDFSFHGWQPDRQRNRLACLRLDHGIYPLVRPVRMAMGFHFGRDSSDLDWFR